ncbi:MAG: CsbD family protein [Planctomycetota bacterium]
MKEPWMKGKWNEYKGKAKQRWGKLTDDDLQEVGGRRDELLGKVQQRYGVAKADAEREVNEWERKHGPK